VTRLRIFLCAVLVGGCSLLAPPEQVPARYELDELPTELPNERHHSATIIVLPPEASAAFDTTRMAYQEQQHQIGYFRDHEWAEPPPQMVQRALVRVLEQTGSFRTVLTPPDTSLDGYVLRTQIVELLQDFTIKPPELRLDIRAELLGPTGRIVATRDIRSAEPLREVSAYGGVQAANRAFAAVLAEVTRFVLAHAR
jgi:cholesterol transport system auxiliary component